MARKRRCPNLIFLYFFFSHLAFLQPTAGMGKQYEGVKGMFVFGSSLVDNGNNNFINETVAKANYPPYGVDFPLGPSGRSTNGKNVIDLLGNHLRLPDYLPVFNDPSTTAARILHGVNYASAASGILDDTGSVAGRVINLNEQIKNFEQVTLRELERQVGSSKSREIVGESIFVVGSGGNDYTFNYFLYQLDTNISLQHFTSNLTSNLASQLQKLYNGGARKIVVMAIYPLGCSPSGRARQPFRMCNRILNQAAHMFNANLRSLVDSIPRQLPGATLVYVNSYKIIRDIIRNPTSNGFSDTRNPCCEVGGNEISCKRGGLVCANRGDHVYFDGLHPTETLNVVLATKAYSSNRTAEVYPFNIQHLANI